MGGFYMTYFDIDVFRCSVLFGYTFCNLCVRRIFFFYWPFAIVCSRASTHTITPTPTHSTQKAIHFHNWAGQDFDLIFCFIPFSGKCEYNNAKCIHCSCIYFSLHIHYCKSHNELWRTLWLPSNHRINDWGPVNSIHIFCFSVGCCFV